MRLHTTNANQEKAAYRERSNPQGPTKGKQTGTVLWRLSAGQQGQHQSRRHFLLEGLTSAQSETQADFIAKASVYSIVRG